MKILFLDIDGVLWGYSWVEEMKANGMLKKGKPFLSHMPEFKLDPKCIDLLNLILKETECSLVISSSWRCFMTESELFDRLTNEGMSLDKDWYLGFTPDFTKRPRGSDLYIPSQRGDEIKSWIDNNYPDAGFVVIDDDSDMRGVEDSFVKIDIKTGLTISNVNDVLEKFNRFELV